MAVDDNIASFTDPTTGEVQTDISAGNVYVAWATGTVAPASTTSPFRSPFFNPNVDRDGHFDGWRAGFQRSSELNSITSWLYGPTTERDAVPAITISQGRLPDESGQQGDAGVPGGQVTVGWSDTAANEHQLMVNSIPAWSRFSF